MNQESQNQPMTPEKTNVKGKLSCFWVLQILGALYIIPGFIGLGKNLDYPYHLFFLPIWALTSSILLLIAKKWLWATIFGVLTVCTGIYVWFYVLH